MTSVKTRAALLALLGAFLVLTASIFALRLGVVIQYGDLLPTSGIESVVLYSLWKLQHGYALYEWPNQPPYTVTIYNYLFYHSYAALLSALGAVDAGMLLPGRLIAAGCSLIGAAFTYLLVDCFSPAVRRVEVRCVIALLSLILWFGSGSTAWHTLTMRPDIAAVAVATAALWLYVRGRSGASLATSAGASALFYVAWGLKQVCIWTWLAVIAHALVTRRWREAAVVALPAMILVVGTLAWNDEAYTYNIFVAPTLSHYEFYPWLSRLARFVMSNLLFLLVPIIAVAAWASVAPRTGRGASGRGGRWARLAHACLHRYGPLPAVAVFATAMGVAALARWGSEKNHLLEGLVALGALSTILLVNLVYGSPPPARRWRLALLGLVVAGAAFPGAQLLHAAGLPVFGMSYVATWTEDDYREKLLISRHMMQGADQPLFVTDEILAQPWHATSNRYPAFVLDPIYYATAKEKGLLGGGGIEELVAQGAFRTIVIDVRFHSVYEAAQRAGYAVKPWPAELPPAPFLRVMERQPKAREDDERRATP